jgi:OOP family OmpA-OmpF porin
MRYIITLTVILAAGSSFAQNVFEQKMGNDTMPNLVKNPGFEEYTKLQCAWTQDIEKFNENIVGWNSPTETTPDIISTAVSEKCPAHPKRRSNMRQLPRTGEVMMGIKTYGKGNTPTYWHEYIQVKLEEPLVKGNKYVGEFWILRDEGARKASNNFGLYFSDTVVNTRDRLPLYFTPQVNEPKMIRKRSWYRVKGVFIAPSDSKYVLVGNFYGDKYTDFESVEGGKKGGAYYLIDDVNVRIAPKGAKLSDVPPESIKPKPKMKVVEQATTKEIEIIEVEPEVGITIVLDNIFFEVDKSTLLPTSKKELEELVDLMIDYPHLRIEINGHTDNTGGDAHNQQLSKARAKAVVDYLLEEKVEEERLNYNGYGEGKPIAENGTDEGRQQNRRVEFKVLQVR